jgi:sugar lactone lactonase YvrE
MAIPIADAQTPDVPEFAVDTTWPKPLPNRWAVGPVSGIATDFRDHIWILHRIETVRQAGNVPAPPVIEFDAAGNIVQTWGGPGTGYEWPQQVHGITIDAKDRVWISGNGDTDTHLLVFTREGKFLRQIGRPGQKGGNDDRANVARATQMRVDIERREVFVSDGEMNQHHRVIVFDSETGAYKRHWGAYGERPDDVPPATAGDRTASPPKRFGTAVHCLRIDRDGLVYVCDRSNNRIQIFRKDGTFQKEFFVAKDSGAAGTVYDLAFSPDQRFMYVADGGNQKVWIVRRAGLEVVGSFGARGAGAGQFATSLHDLTVDASGNVYTGEAAAAGRVQKFAIKTRKP